MTDKISKELAKFTAKERAQVKEILVRLTGNDATSLHITKLKGHPNIFRVRKGKLRIIYRQIGEKIKVLAIERRSEKTYRDY